MKVTKSQIMKDLRTMRVAQLEAKQQSNNEKVAEYKAEIINKYTDTIRGLITKLEPIYTELKAFQDELSKDKDINLMERYNNDFINQFTTEKRAKEYISDYAYWYRGSVQVLKNKLDKEVEVLETEWENLLINCSTLTLKQLKQFLEDNKIYLPCMSEEHEETAVAVMNVNLDLLFGGERNAK